MQRFSFRNTQNNTIDVSSHFATLVEETEEKYIFQIVFSVLQSNIVANSLNKIKIKCFNPDVLIEKSGTQVLSSSPPRLNNSIQQIGLSQINNIRLNHQRQLKLARSKSNSIIAESIVNLQTYVDSRIISLLKRGKKPDEIEELYSEKDSLILLQDDYNFDEYSEFQQSDVKDCNFELISNGIHPASVVSKFNNSNDDKIISLRNYYLNDSLALLNRETSYFAVSKQRKLNDKISIKTLLEIPKNLVKNSIQIRFEIFKFERKNNCSLFSSDVPVERINRSIDVLKHSKFFKLQNDPPIISFSGFDIETKQVDKNSDKIKIEKKEINNLGECTKYSLVEESLVLPNNSISIKEAEPDTKFSLFRCLASNSSTTVANSLISCIVIGKTNTKINTLTMSITDRKNSFSGVEINVKHPPKFISQFQISKRQWSGSAFDSEKILFHYQNFEGDSTIVLDEEIKHTDICQYILSYKTENGTVKKNYMSTTYQYFKDVKKSGISVAIENPVLSMVKGKPEFSFTILPTIPATDADLSYASANLTGIGVSTEDYKRKDSLTSVSDTYTHIVSRLNLKTGLRENFLQNYSKDRLYGADANNIVIRDTPANRKINNVSDLDMTVDYLYEVISHRKNTLATMRDYIDIVKLPASSVGAPRICYYRPFKWRQNYTEETGTLPAMDNKNNLLTKTFIEDGAIGVTATYLLSQLSKSLEIHSIIAERLDINKTRISWKLQGSLDDFDHFVIVKEVGRIRRFVGATYTQDVTDVLENNDVGTIIYYVIPVLFDFSPGIAGRSNAILIDPEDSDFKQQISEI